MGVRCLLYLAIALSLAPLGRCAAECIQTASEVGRNGAVLSAYVCRAVSPWRYIPALITPVKVTLNCPTAKVRSCRRNATGHRPVLTLSCCLQFSVHIGTNAKPPGKEIRWCGFKHLHDPKTCFFEVAPFQDTWIRIKSGEGAEQHTATGLAYQGLSSTICLA
jgi:hypothetical protein